MEVKKGDPGDNTCQATCGARISVLTVCSYEKWGGVILVPVHSDPINNGSGAGKHLDYVTQEKAHAPVAILSCF